MKLISHMQPVIYRSFDHEITDESELAMIEGHHKTCFCLL